MRRRSPVSPAARRLALSGLLAAALSLGAAAPAALAQDGVRLSQEAARHQTQGNFDQAMALLTEALGDTRLTNDARAVILTDRGALHARLNQPKAAIEDFNRAVALYPEYPAVYNNRGSTLVTLGIAREAIKDFDRAILLAPGYVAAYSNRAGARLLLGQVDLAIADYSRAIELSPDTVPALAGRGRAQLAAGRPQAATRDLGHALASDNRFALGYRLRAEARLDADKAGEAIEDLSRAIAFEPQNPAIYVERGLAYMAADNVSAALKDYARALELDPRSLAALEARALAHVKAEAESEAEADIARALELDPRAAGAMAARALLLLKSGQPDAARREIERAAKVGAGRVEVLLAKARIDEVNGRRDEAVQGYRAALARHGAQREAAVGLARITGGSERGDTVELRGLGVDSWRVVRRGERLYAISDDYPRISVPLETTGESQPRLIGIEQMRPPNRDIAVLRFNPGQAASAEQVVHAAILDVVQGEVLGIVPDRIGTKQATLSFEDNKLVVTAADGLRDEFVLRSGGRGAAVAAAGHPRRSSDQPRAYAPPGWLPWGAGPPMPSQQQRRAQRPQQPKTLFNLLFGN